MFFLCCPDWSWISRLKSHSPASLSWVTLTPRTYYYTWLYQHSKQTRAWPMLFKLFLCSIFPPSAPHLTCSCVSSESHLYIYWLNCLSSCVLSNSKQFSLALTNISRNNPCSGSLDVNTGADHLPSLVLMLLLTSPCSPLPRLSIVFTECGHCACYAYDLGLILHIQLVFTLCTTTLIWGTKSFAFTLS